MKYRFLIFKFNLLFILFACSNCSSQKSKPDDSGSAKNAAFKEYDTLTTIFAVSNYVYYYDNELTIDESSNNFKMSNSGKGIRSVLTMFELEAAKKKENLLVILKIQSPDKLNETSKATIELIKKRYFFEEVKLNEVEPELIRIIEEANGIKSQ